MKYLLFGGNGWLAGYLLKGLKSTNVDVILAKSRADSEIDVEKEIKSYRAQKT